MASDSTQDRLVLLEQHAAASARTILALSDRVDRLYQAVFALTDLPVPPTILQALVDKLREIDRVRGGR